ncbi:OSCP1 [Bugula neritina]|uniref:OSCP1 n=1 Tax=Bugula neritina TaxID=10212 RepID=A0A7J7JTA4_BUGNE|nr:OSCP1 [Bugula neritina]
MSVIAVLNDIISTMFNKRYMDEIFKPQELHSKKAMRTVFDRLAHASIMRLNAASMDKLYDLMTMAIKYQVTLCSQPRDLLLVTLNHLDGIRAMVHNQPIVISTLDSLYHSFMDLYGKMQYGELQTVRQCLLTFFQDMHVRVSIFLKEGQQNQSGRFVLPRGGTVPMGSQVPGKIVLYDQTGEVRQRKQFHPGSTYKVAQKEGSLDLTGDRVTKLGCNMYSTHKPSETTTSGVESKKTSNHRTLTQAELSTPDPLAKAQLDLLSHLIGSGSASKTSFRINLFNNDEEEENYVSPVANQIQQEGTEFVEIDARKRTKDKYLDRVMGEMNISGGGASGDDDLLDLMDQA